MFQFPPLASVTYIRISVLQTDGLSHSEIPGSKVICTYPRLIAAYHVLHRLCEPRHPPCALSYFLLISSDHKKLKALWTTTPLILSAVLVILTFYSFVLCQYVKDLFSHRILFDWLRLHFVYQILTKMWRITDSNRWPPACKAGALASWANPPNS